MQQSFIAIAICIYNGEQVLEEKGKKTLFNVQLVGLTKEVKYHDGSFSIHPDKLLAEAVKNDLIIIPALTGAMVNSVHINKDYIDWIIDQYKNGVEIAGLSTGVFMLAFSGLLKGKEISLAICK
jgi:transcriptional regulator GlxA family with amidase domain